MKQPALGIAASAVAIALSLGFIALFSFLTFTTWVAFLAICFIPTQIVMTVLWECKHPGFAAGCGQPGRGILFLLFGAAIGAIVAVIHFTTVGGRVDPPAPMLAMCIIASVIVTFWLVIVWGGWPFNKLIKSPVGAGLALLIVCYAINYLLFRLFFDFRFMQGAPVYVAALDPQGLFNAWNAVVFYITTTSVMFLVLNFDLWPFTKSKALMQQPMLGIVWSSVMLVVGGLAFYVGVYVVKMDVVSFMVRVPIPFIFGTIVVLNMLQGSLFSKLQQPAKGVLNTIASAAIGEGLAWVYGALAPVVTGRLRIGPPGYDFEIWLASALLGVTFPLLIIYADFFRMWPLQKDPK